MFIRSKEIFNSNQRLRMIRDTNIENHAAVMGMLDEYDAFAQRVLDRGYGKDTPLTWESNFDLNKGTITLELIAHNNPPIKNIISNVLDEAAGDPFPNARQVFKFRAQYNPDFDYVEYFNDSPKRFYGVSSDIIEGGRILISNKNPRYQLVDSAEYILGLPDSTSEDSPEVFYCLQHGAQREQVVSYITGVSKWAPGQVDSIDLITVPDIAARDKLDLKKHAYVLVKDATGDAAFSALKSIEDLGCAISYVYAYDAVDKRWIPAMFTEETFNTMEKDRDNACVRFIVETSVKNRVIDLVVRNDAA